MFGVLKRNQQGWLGVGVHADRVDLAHVLRESGQRPRLAKLESYGSRGNLSQALSALGKQKTWRAYRCTTLLGPGSYQINLIDSPDVPAAELKEAVRWRLKDILDYPVDACTVDVVSVPVENLAGRPQPIFAVSANNDVLAPRIQAFDQAKLGLEAVDIPEMAQRNIAALCEDENRGLALLAMDSTGGVLTFTYRSELYSVRRIEITSEQVERADEEKRRQLFERVGLELQRSLDNFERQYNFISVSKVMLGPSTFAADLAGFLRDYVYVPVQALDLTSIIDCDAVPEIREAALQAERFSVIGAALRDEVRGKA